MRLSSTMSHHCLLAPIQECPAGYFMKDIKLAVLGTGSMGKSAMIVRYLTRRFIGDYEPNTGNLYSRLVHVEDDQIFLQIQDTPGCIELQEDIPQMLDSLSRCLKWADGFLLVYSVTDCRSYQSIRPLFEQIWKSRPDSKTPVIIVGNKADLTHARQVAAKDGLQLANELDSVFLEISTSDTSKSISNVILGQQPKDRWKNDLR
ncbi:ras-like protein family member 11A [Heteronotia binoei]|uniref:ras-like protein family member 11A n=1 Tax=Heteronotia binoei TaxID=13085 RepID=UPI00293140C6|nr:ras-like protein family member 11A [Heteronotia binoei]